jgi:cell division protein FtsZ
MGNDVRLTLIATGFATKEGLAGLAREQEIQKLLKGTKKEEFEVPAFIRQSGISTRY